MYCLDQNTKLQCKYQQGIYAVMNMMPSCPLVQQYPKFWFLLATTRSKAPVSQLMNELDWCGYKEYLVGEVREEAFNQILMYKLIF